MSLSCRGWVVVAVLPLLLSLVGVAGVAARETGQSDRVAAVVPTDSDVTLALVPVYTDLLDPLFVTHAGDGTARIFIVGRWGTIWVAGGNLAEPETFLDITEIVRGNHGEQGLLGLAFAPDYVASGRFYVYYTDKDARQVVARYSVSSDPNRADPESGEPLYVMADRAPNHNGGMLAFGPDGYLYIGTGDEGGGGDTYQQWPEPDVALGKILRIDVSPEEGYAIPPDNPFVLAPSGAPGNLGLGRAQPLALLVRSADRRPVHRRCRASDLGGDQLPPERDRRRREPRLADRRGDALLPARHR